MEKKLTYGPNDVVVVLGPFSEPSRRPLVPPRLVVVGTPVPLSRQLRRSTHDPLHEQLLAAVVAWF